MSRAYKYRCRDNSLLTPWFKTYMVEPLVALTPYAIPANIITIVSNLFVYAAAGLAIVCGSSLKWNFILIPLFLLIYVIGDHLDGMQAKRTGTGSPLGEFCDHFLDTFNNGLVVIILMGLYNLQNELVLISLLTSSYLAHASIFYHQFQTGWLVFEKIGSLEAMLFTISMLLLSSFSPVYDLLTAEFLGLKIIEYILVASSLGATATFIRSLVDSNKISISFSLFTVGFIGVSVLILAFPFSLFNYGILILYASCYIGGLMRGHLVDGHEPRPELLSVLVLALVYFFSWEIVILEYLFYLLLIRTFLLTTRTVHSLKDYWVWANSN